MHRTDTVVAEGSRYRHDPRVVPYPLGDETAFTVTADDGAIYEVLYTDIAGWVICPEGSDEPVEVAGGGYAIHIATADDAIAAIVGDPQGGE